MIQLTKRGILARKLLHGVRVAHALCAFDVWYEGDSKISTLALVIGALQCVLFVLFAILSWAGVISSNVDITRQLEPIDESKFTFWTFWVINVVFFVIYTVFKFTQFKNRRTCGIELCRIYKNFEKFSIDTRNVGRDFCLFIILFLPMVTFGLQELLDYIIIRSQVPILNICVILYTDMANIFVDFTFIGGIYLLYLLYKSLNEKCSLLNEVSDSIRYQIAIVKFVREQHQDLASLAQNIVNVYKLPLLLSIVRVIVTLIIRMYDTFDLTPGLSESDVTRYTHNVMIFISLHIFRMFMMCNICTLMTSEANRTNTVLSEVESNNPYLYMRHERASLSLYLTQQNVRIRPWNMCEIDNGLFFSVVGTVLAYLFYFVDTSKVQQ